MRLHLPHPQPPSYKASLVPMARYAAISSVIAETIFTFLYWGSGYPFSMMAIQVSANLLGLSGLVWIYRKSDSRVASQILVLAVYLSLMGPILFSNGLRSSAIPWLVFIPMMAAMIAGARASLFWGAVSLFSVIAMYLARDNLLPLAVYPTQDIDRLSDLLFAVLSSVVAVFGNELVKSHAMKELDEAKVQLTDLANVDPLTNIYNRRYFNLQSELALQRCGEGVPFSILLFDIDHFKKVNDQHGHNVGDQVLSCLVHPCSAVLRKNDTFARLGGEEFIALLPDTSEAEARDIAERLRTTIENTPMMTDNGPMQITISIGISVCSPSEILSIQELIRRADDAMYRAKETGRNKVVLWRELPQLNFVLAD